MDTGRIKIVLATMGLLTLARVLLSVLEKSTFMDLAGWFGPPIVAVLSTILIAWFIIISVAINLLFYDQSTTPLFTVAGIVIVALILKSFELGWNAIP
jgi:hypothetical protein